MMSMGEILAFPTGRKLSVKQADPSGIQKKLLQQKLILD